MKKLKIIDKNNYKYKLLDEKNVIYNLVLEFYDIKKPKVGSFIYINEKLLDCKYVGYSGFYAFGSLEGKYGKKLQSLNDEDVIILVSKKEKIYLKRYYG